MNQPTTPNTVEDFLPLPDNGPCSDVQHGMLYTGRQMRAYVLADRAQRPTVAGSVDIDELSNFIRQINGNNTMGAGALAEKIVEWFNARLALAAPSGEANNEIPGLAERYNDVLRELAAYVGAGGYNSDGMIDPAIAKAKIEWGIDELVRHAPKSHPAPSEIEAAVELPDLPAYNIDLGYTTLTLTSYATEAVLKERAARKESTK